MNAHSIRRILVPLALAVALVSCQITGVDRAQKAADSMKRAGESLAAAPDRIEAVVASLGVLGKAEGDMQAQYAGFSDEVDAMVKHNKRAKKLSEELESNKGSFVDAWELRIQEIQNEDLREKAMERREAVVTEFGELGDQLTEVRDDFDPWMQDVLDLRTYLENDLNPSGVKSISKTIKGVTKRGNSIKEDLEDLVEDLEKLATKIAATKPPPPPKK